MGSRTTPGQESLLKLQGYLNGQPDILTAIVKHRTSTKGNVGDLYIQDFDPEGHFVTLVTRPPPEGKDVLLKIPFNPPIKNIFEVRPRMMYWRDEAEKHFKVPKRPVIGYYKPPPYLPYFLPAVLGLSLLIFLCIGRGNYADQARAWAVMYTGKNGIKAGAYIAAFFHLGLEPIYMIWATGKHNVPTGDRVRWVLMTVLSGFAAINEFWECVQYERIRHIYAQTDVGPLPPTVAPRVSKEKKTK